ncbi:MAG TPA: amidase family protein [Kofleriaceae bacterium]|nr:amidase family protein [Kofleriaceae bacterium]
MKPIDRHRWEHGEPCLEPARVLARMVRERQISAVELLEAHLARIARHNDALRAVVSLDADRARQRAAAADAALARGETWGPLHGVPMTLKDAHDVAGQRTTVGTEELDRVAQVDGTVAARLRAAGAILIGHTNVAAWLGDPLQSANPLFGRTGNPWDASRTPGGSSGGAAAALAAGMTPLEVGSDLAGSIRLPAHFCGVHGMKTTEHRVPFTGFFAPPGRAPRAIRIMSCLGPMARDLVDLRMALEIIAGPDGQDSDVPPVPLAAPGPRALGHLRLAVVASMPGPRVATAIRRALERVAAEAERAGARVDDRLPDVDWGELFELAVDLVSTITSLSSPGGGAELRDEQRTLAWYFTALERRDRLIAAWQRYFDDVDALLLPAATTTAFTHREAGAPVEVDGEETSYWQVAGALLVANLTGQPALALPAGRDQSGLPIGVQMVGPLWSEPRLLDIAGALEEAGVLPGFTPPPAI